MKRCGIVQLMINCNKVNFNAVLHIPPRPLRDIYKKEEQKLIDNASDARVTNSTRRIGPNADETNATKSGEKLYTETIDSTTASRYTTRV